LAWDWSRPCSRGGKVTVIARVGDALESVRARLGVVTISADVTDETATHRILAEVRPDILALNTGATPRMSRLDQLSWAVFTAPWEHGSRQFADLGVQHLQVHRRRGLLGRGLGPNSRGPVKQLRLPSCHLGPWVGWTSYSCASSARSSRP
jgi:hypothetical protein